MATFISRSPESTIALGMEWGAAAQSGWVIALSGDLGTGKTQLVKGVALGLGIAAEVHSPTFALLLEYGGGRLPLVHVDLYRLETPEQVIGAGLEEYLYPRQGITVVEWAERWWGAPPRARPAPGFLRRARIEWQGETERCIEYEDLGAGVLVGSPQRGPGS